MKTKALSILGRPLMVACVSAAMYSAHVAPAQEPDSPAKDKNESADNANKRKLAVMRKLAEAIHVKTGEGEASNQAKLIPEPLFRFSDQARLLPDGSVWGWGTAGRPVMMVEFRTYDRTPGEWGYDLTATSDVQFSADVTGHGRWAPRKSDFKLLPAGDIAPPAKTEAARLRQMKQFARSLNASELWKGQRSELRLLPTEVHRYSDAASGIVDGALHHCRGQQPGGDLAGRGASGRVESQRARNLEIWIGANVRGRNDVPLGRQRGVEGARGSWRPRRQLLLILARRCCASACSARSEVNQSRTIMKTHAVSDSCPMVFVAAGFRAGALDGMSRSSHWVLLGSLEHHAAEGRRLDSPG